MNKEELIKKFNEIYKCTLILESIDGISDRSKVRVRCNKCKHSWPASLKNVITFRSGCYDCCRGKGYSMDEIKILNYIQDNYLNDRTFRHAEHGIQLKITPEAPKFDPTFRPPLYYSCDGYSRFTYVYDKETKTLNKDTSRRGTVFEVLGDYHHSNPYYYKPDDESPRKGMSHRENYYYTMSRLKHIEEQGFEVYYIWITDFRRFTRELEKGTNPNIFDYMNVEKKYSKDKHDTSLLSRATRELFNRNKFTR